MSVGDDGLNLLFIDAAAAYWSSELLLPVGTQLRLRGHFPHARYMSLVTYDGRRRTIDHLTDVDIRPDAGATNPFVAGARRDAAQRSFTIRIVDDARPATKTATNILYARAASARASSEPVRVTLRVYQPDQGLALVDMALPQVEIVEPDGDSRIIPPCAQSAEATVKNRIEGILSMFLTRRFVDMTPLAWSIFTPDGLGENVDNAYIYTAFDPKRGPVLSFGAKAPSSPRSFFSEPVMGRGELRYWSFCTSRMTTAVIGCAVDEFIPLDRSGHFLIVMTTPADRPSNAVMACGVTWLAAPPSGPGALIYRHMLPAPEFAHSFQSLGASRDLLPLSDYLPRGRYFSKEAFEALGCPVTSAAITVE